MNASPAAAAGQCKDPAKIYSPASKRCVGRHTRLGRQLGRSPVALRKTALAAEQEKQQAREVLQELQMHPRSPAARTRAQTFFATCKFAGTLLVGFYAGGALLRGAVVAAPLAWKAGKFILPIAAKAIYNSKMEEAKRAQYANEVIRRLNARNQNRTRIAAASQQKRRSAFSVSRRPTRSA